MVKCCKPWEGTNWIKQRALPKVPQVVVDGFIINDLDQMFEQMHSQFVQSAAIPANSAFVDMLPQRPQHLWPPFSQLELSKALAMCSNALAPGPSHFSWEYLKLFLKDDSFSTFFLQLANNIVTSGVWPSAFKTSNSVIIPKPKKDNYSRAKSHQPITLLECPGKLISKVIANHLQSDIIVYEIAHPLQFGGRKMHSTTDTGLFLTEYITTTRNDSLYTSTLALDATQFFPSLHHKTIVKIL